MSAQHGWPTAAVRSAAVVLTAVATLCLATAASAQVVNPANQGSPDSPQAPTTEDTPRHTWDMPPITVYGQTPLKEEDRIGEYEQPRWTADRRFGETRVYVIPQGKFEFEYWLRPHYQKNGEPATMEHMYEVELGLPGRFQIDLYTVATKTGNEGSFGINEQKFEVRWAFAKWGRIWGNPTAYAEWVTPSEEPDRLELKLLLGDQITSGLHWGSNLVWDHGMGGTHDTSNEWTFGLSKTIQDMKFSAGIETQLAWVNEDAAGGGRTPFSNEFLIGPSFQMRPLPRMHIDFAPLFGTTAAAERAKIYVVLGWEF
jgi:hypothetical protein